VDLEVGPGPFHLVVKKSEFFAKGMDFSTWVKPSSRVRAREERLSLGILVIDLSEVRWWDPMPDWNEVYRQHKLILRNSKKLVPHLLRNAPSESLMQVMENPSNPEFGFDVCSEAMPITMDRVVKAAFKPIQHLMQGIIQGQKSILEQGVRSLAGLGGGLTPAGDDFILGSSTH
jgi:hypothetical protein